MPAQTADRLSRHALSGALLLVVLAGVLLACATRTGPATGASLYAQDCAACHGGDARGADGGPALTGLVRDNGDSYPARAVLDRLDGYARGRELAGRRMPEFGHLLAGPLVRVALPDGTSRPYPEPMVALNSYLASLQD